MISNENNIKELKKTVESFNSENINVSLFN